MLKLLTALVMLMASNTPAEAKVEIGKTAPEFAAVTTMGKNFSLSDFKGNYVVLEWANYDCPFVRKFYDAGKMQSLQKYYSEEGVVWLTIISSAKGKQGYLSVDEANAQVKEEGAAPWGVVRDASGGIGRMYNAKTTPHMFIINPEGKVMYKGAIDSIHSANTDDLDKAINYISTAFDDIKAGNEVRVASTTPYGCSVKY